MPPAVRDYVLLHELMHLRVRNHSPRFWQQVARVCPQVNDARRWLREQGRELL
jgi:predicted metal-dependent hydrolase